MAQIRIDVIIPTYKPDKKLLDLIAALQKQTVKPAGIILVNTEEKYLNSLFYGTDFLKKYPQIRIKNISKREFNHGKTRNQGAKRSDAEIMVFMTQDAMPADENVEVRAYDITQTIETQVDEATHRVVTIYRYHIRQNPSTASGFFRSSIMNSVASAGYIGYLESGGEEDGYVVFTSENSNSDMREDFVEKMNEFTAYTKGTGGGVVKKFIGYVAKTIFMMLILAASVSLCDQLSSKIFGTA
jgi:glycosyltransferase involved in cell wall biosynthesis